MLGIEILSEFLDFQGGIAHLAHLGGFLGAYIYMRKLDGERFGDMLRKPLKGMRRNRDGHVSVPAQSRVNRQTFEDIMAEIEEIERGEDRKQADNSHRHG